MTAWGIYCWPAFRRSHAGVQGGAPSEIRLAYPWEHVGQTYMAQGEFDEAVSAFQRYLSCAQRVFEIICSATGRRGFGLRRSTRRPSRLREALKLYPDHFYIVGGSESARTAGSPVEARKFREGVLEHSEGSSRARIFYGGRVHWSMLHENIHTTSWSRFWPGRESWRQRVQQGLVRYQAASCMSNVATMI